VSQRTTSRDDMRGGHDDGETMMIDSSNHRTAMEPVSSSHDVIAAPLPKQTALCIACSRSVSHYICLSVSVWSMHTWHVIRGGGSWCSKEPPNFKRSKCSPNVQHTVFSILIMSVFLLLLRQNGSRTLQPRKICQADTPNWRMQLPPGFTPTRSMHHAPQHKCAMMGPLCVKTPVSQSCVREFFSSTGHSVSSVNKSLS